MFKYFMYNVYYVGGDAPLVAMFAEQDEALNVAKALTKYHNETESPYYIELYFYKKGYSGGAIPNILDMKEVRF